MDIIKDHIIAVPAVAAVLAYALGRVDDIIIFLLRFFQPETIKAELDRLEAVAKARIDLDAAKSTPKT